MEAEQGPLSTFSKCSANVSITDGNSEYSVEGAEYDIYRSSDNALVSHIVTDASGNAALDLEPNQAYYAVETKAPAGYTLHEGPYRLQDRQLRRDRAAEGRPGCR